MAGVSIGYCSMVGTGTAQSGDATVSATITSATGTSLTNSHVVFADQETHEWYRADIDESGDLQTELPAGVTYDMVYFHQAQGDLIRPDFDGVPVIYDLDEVTVESGSSDLGNYTVPKGYVTNIQVQSRDGNPLQNVPLSFYVPSGAGTGPRSFSTNENGYVVHAQTSTPGIELAGSIMIRTHQAGGGGEMLDNIFIESESEISVVLRNPEEYNGVVERTESGATSATETTESEAKPATEAADSSNTVTPADSSQPTRTDQSPSDTASTTPGRQRGFFSNDAEEPRALSNPLNLTVGGFVLSVAGIVYQMIGGK